MTIENKEAEKGVLACCVAPQMGSTNAVDTAIEAGCSSGWFHSAPRRMAWEAIYALHTDGQPVDLLTVTGKTKDYSTMEDVCSAGAIAANIDFHIAEADKAFKRREASFVGIGLQDRMGDAGCDIERIIADVGDQLDVLISNRNRRTLREHMMDNIKVLKDGLLGKMSGLPLPWAKFSNVTGGVQAQSATPLVGRDGKGKSGACAQIADFWAGEGVATLYISLEDAPRRTLLRMAGCRKWFSARNWEMGSSVVDGKRVILCNEEGRQLEQKLLDYTDWLEERRVEVIDGDFTGEQVALEVMAFRRRHGIKDEEVIGVIVDGFKDLVPSHGDSTTSEEKWTASKLQKGAKRGNAGMLVVSHILKIDDGVPIKKEHIKGSGAQFQGARQVLIFQDAGVTGKTDDEDHFVISATKANFANGGSAWLRRDENVLSYQEL